MTERAAEAGRTLGLVLGGACVLAGLGLAAFYAFVWMSPESAPIPFVPFFDKPRLWRSGFLLASASVAVSLLAIVGTLLLRRARLAPLAFLLAGWGGLAVTIAGLWPGRRVSFMLQTAVSQAERAGAPAGTTIWDLVPQGALIAGIAFGVIWIGLLVVGSLHVVLHKRLYR